MLPKLSWRTFGPFVFGVLVGCGGKEVLEVGLRQIINLPV